MTEIPVTKSKYYPACQLRVTVDNDEEFPTLCDGCGTKIGQNEKYITDIESCCGGGCSRNLCSSCIATANKLLGIQSNMNI